MPVRPPKETNQLAKYILDVTTGEEEKIEPPKKNPHAQALSKLGASKGGKERAKRLTPTKRHLIAKGAAQARWKKRQSE
jgi:hypothetical protein